MERGKKRRPSLAALGIDSYEKLVVDDREWKKVTRNVRWPVDRHGNCSVGNEFFALLQPVYSRYIASMFGLAVMVAPCTVSKGVHWFFARMIADLMTSGEEDDSVLTPPIAESTAFRHRIRGFLDRCHGGSCGCTRDHLMDGLLADLLRNVELYFKGLAAAADDLAETVVKSAHSNAELCDAMAAIAETLSTKGAQFIVSLGLACDKQANKVKGDFCAGLTWQQYLSDLDERCLNCVKPPIRGVK